MTDADPRSWGIDPGYHDYAGSWHETPPETERAILAAMGADAPAPPSPDVGSVWVVRAGQAAPLGGRWELRAEDGGTQWLEGWIPPDLPLGYHALTRDGDGRRVRLVVSPGSCHLRHSLRTWGLAAQLYATRSRSSWGIGDLADLRTLGEWSSGLGAGMVLVNPLHAPLPGLPQQASPYYPSSRCFRSPLYLRVEDVPGAAALGEDLERWAAAGRALNDDRIVDRDAVHRLKADALERLFARFTESGGDAAFDAYVAELGASLEGYATFCALSEEHGRPWSEWPADVRRPDSPAVARFREERADRVRFHSWLQWLVDVQLRRAGEALGVVQDLAIGCDPAGADAWLWQDVFDLDVKVGAPPDEFNTQGQDWGLPPLDPWRLREAAFEPFIQTVRAGLRHAGGLRVDHVMGLFRLFWIPSGAGPADGTYVRYPSAELLDILALESRRAEAYVVGEDLGTVEEGVREELERRRVLSYRLLWFEPDPPSQYPRQALAAVTTHDLPTVAGLIGGADFKEQQDLGLEPNEEGTLEMLGRVRAVTGLGEDASVDEVVVATYRALAEAPSMIVTATLDDALAVEDRPNVPGTTDERPNWSLALPKPLDDLVDDPRVRAVADAVSTGR